MRAAYFVGPIRQPLELKGTTGRVNFRKVVAAAGIAGALIFTSACSASVAASPSGTSSPVGSASAAATPSATPSPTGSFPYTLPSGLIAKGIAYDGKGEYVQTSIADTDPAMKYSPVNTDAAAKAHYSEAELAEAQKVIVRFIAEEAIDSTLNGGSSDVSGWFTAHKDQIHPLNQDLMLKDLKEGNQFVARENWMAARPGVAYAHGDSTPRVTARTIAPLQLRYVTSPTLQGVMLDTNVTYDMAVIYDEFGKKVQSTIAEISFAAAKDPADNKWKIAGYKTDFHTGEHIKK